MELLGIKHITVIAYHHQSNGLAERLNKSVEEQIQFSINTSKATSHGFTPFFLNHGREPIMPQMLDLVTHDKKLTLKDYKYQHTKNLHEGIALAQQNLPKRRSGYCPLHQRRKDQKKEVISTLAWTISNNCNLTQNLKWANMTI